MAKQYLVTGGGGFLGAALCRAIVNNSNSVVALCRGDYPELRNLGIKIFRHDLRNPIENSLDEYGHFEGVFHTASKVEMWGPYQSFFDTNVIGTRNVINFCLQNKIPNLVYTSSPSVIADGKHTSGIDESYPYPTSHMAPYPATKAIAEREVLAANSDTLYTISLRPHLIWGPGDRHLVPTIINRAKSGRLVQVGNGENLVDTSFIEDCVEAHLLAMNALSTNPKSRGRAYFVSQGQPVKLWDWINNILALKNLPPVTRRIPAGLAKFIGKLCEIGVSIVPGNREPFLTQFLASQMSSDHYFNISAAKRDLGYQPKFSIEQALKATFD